MILEGNLATGKSSALRIWGRKTICWSTETKGLKSFELEEHLFPRGEQRLAFWNTESTACPLSLSLH